ncbi:MAG: methylated-DNA--[protein]-cysteine S-methyltransferase [Acidimicrobiales bacterium]|nr:methylated-DNA--[protein]-cysteine S-methyltransferase [Acidimicrobiales bacterium]
MTADLYVSDLHLPPPIDDLEIVASDVGLVAILWKDDERWVFSEAVKQENAATAAVKQQLKEYFAGERTEFDLPLDLRGTEFQTSVWRSLSIIPYGTTVTYSEQAQRLGRPSSVRAVASANGSNPVSIVLPCHRVIGSNGKLTGYAGGLDAKRWLLTLEGATDQTLF